MEISGKIIEILPEQSGQGKSKPWVKQDFILETNDQYPKKVAIQVWNDNIAKFALNAGDELDVSYNLESREYNGNWYTSITAWKVVKTQSAADKYEAKQQASVTEDTTKDLPF